MSNRELIVKLRGMHRKWKSAIYAEAADALEAQEWQPIETAPKDEFILVCQGMHNIQKVAIWHDQFDHWACGVSPMDFIASVTHWKPLDQPPVLDT